jgi:uncharacterized protein with gpF-like domain
MIKATEDAIEVLKRNTAKLKFDATDDEIQSQEDESEAEVIAIFLALVASLSSLGFAIYKFNTQQFLLMALSTGGADNPSVALLNQTGATGSEPWLYEDLKMWQTTSQNSMIKIARDIVADWSTQVRLAVARESDDIQVSDILKGRYSTYKSWSANRASGIVSTFNSRLMRQRLKDANVSRYIWRGKMDDRERESHIALQNKSRTPDQFPFPGEEYNCRCWAIPDWKTRYR